MITQLSPFTTTLPYEPPCSKSWSQLCEICTEKHRTHICNQSKWSIVSWQSIYVRTILQYVHTTNLQYVHTTILQYVHTTILQYVHRTILQYVHTTILQYVQ